MYMVPTPQSRTRSGFASGFVHNVLESFLTLSSKFITTCTSGISCSRLILLISCSIWYFSMFFSLISVF